MADPAKPQASLEIGHVLFLDIVGYSKLLTEEQRATVELLNRVVRGSACFRSAEEADRLTKIATGDGMALVFRDSPESPAECAKEISRAAREHPQLHLRMGVHSGPLSGVVDVTERANVAGSGINTAQRVMDCGDAGHILVSKRVADDLTSHGDWSSCLHDLGECEVKHGLRVHLFNFHGDDFGNAAVPTHLLRIKRAQRKRRLALAAVLVVAVVAALWWQMRPRARPVPQQSIAVLPFENLSRDPENGFFTDGVQDQILTYLARVAALKVISRTSVMQYKTDARRDLRQIGEELGVANLLEGSVQRAANKVRVNAQLIDARTDAHLWAQTYDRDLADVFAIQSEIASAIADQLRAKISPNEKAAIAQQPTADLTAFDQFSRAKTLLLTSELSSEQQKNFLEAVDLLNSAVARDQNFYAAYCELVFAHDQVYALGFDRTPARITAAETALERATQLQADAAETHLARGQHLYYARRDYDGALAELEIAGRSLTNDRRIPATIGYILRRRGQTDESVVALQKAVELDPRNVFTLTQLALTHQLLRRYTDEASVLDHCREIAPEDVNVAGTRALVDLLAHANTQPLHQFIDRVRAERPAALSDTADFWLFCALAERDWPAAEQALLALGTNPLLSDPPIVISRQFAEGLLARAMHDDRRAEQIFSALRAEQAQVVEAQKEYGPAYCLLGLIDAALGNKEAALEEGRRAMELLPVEKDALAGQRLAAYFALIAAWAGEKDVALEQLRIAAPTPGAALITSYGVLKLLPFWDPLRDDPRFEQIVASFASK
ncbi:MAG TPA: adenylate/guanylate cyclase domain-containing protein [Chthoniobacterales bacterium]